MAKSVNRINSRVYLVKKDRLFEIAASLVDGTSTTYANFKIIPKLSETLDDASYEMLIREVMRLLDIGSIEATRLKKEVFKEDRENKKRVDEFRNLDIGCLTGNT